jgi:hypothetical protein
MPDLPDAVSLRQESIRRRDETGPAAPDSNNMPILIGMLVLAGILLVGLGLWLRRRGASPAAPAAVRAGGRGAGRLVVTAGPLQGNQFTVTARGLKIGRDAASCEIVLTEPTVSREHAMLFISGKDQDFVIKNLSGTNSTLVNDRAVQEATLKPGDRIKIGNSVMSYEAN